MIAGVRQCFATGAFLHNSAVWSYNRKKDHVLGLCKADVTWIVGLVGWTLFKRSQKTCKNPRSCLDFSDLFYWIWVMHNIISRILQLIPSRSSSQFKCPCHQPWCAVMSRERPIFWRNKWNIDCFFILNFWILHFSICSCHLKLLLLFSKLLNWRIKAWNGFLKSL